ncbi:MAG: dynamin family protein [Pseudomonadota bacterium]
MQPTHALTERLSSLQSWRYGIAAQIAHVGDFLRAHGDSNAESEALFDAINAKVNAASITIVFVAESGRGKSELINALFFADLGRRLLPSGVLHSTRCFTEVRFDRGKKSGLRLLPIESREAPRRFQDIYDDESAWQHVNFDVGNPETITRAFATLAKTKRVSVADALSWGLHKDSLSNISQDGSSVEVPCWRYASINFPHPLLDAGLVVIDTPGLSALTLEPEFMSEKIPAADAIIVVLDASEGVTKPDLSIWKELFGNVRTLRDRDCDESGQARLVALNKIDRLYVVDELDPKEADQVWLREIDKCVQNVAELMRVEPLKVLPVSAAQALAGKFEANQDAQLKSRVHLLERALASCLPDNRQAQVGKDILSALSVTLENVQATLDQSRFQSLEGLRSLDDLRRKNFALTEAINSEVGSKRVALLAALEELRSVKPIHGALTKDLANLSDPELAKSDAITTAKQIANSMMSGKFSEILDAYFTRSLARITALDAKLNDIRLVFGNLGEKTFRTLNLGPHEIHPFSTHRFLSEIEKAKEKATSELGRSGNLLVRRASTLAQQFESNIAARITLVMEIAHRESAAWMRGVFTGIEKPVEELQKRTNARAGKVNTIRAAELDLAEKISEFQANLDIIKSKHASLGSVREGLERFSGNRRED